MRRWLIIGGIAVALLIVFGILYQSGALQNITWQSMTMVFAALAGPFQSLRNSFKSETENSQIIEARQKYDKMQQEQQLERQRIDAEIAQKQKRIESMDKEVELLDAKLTALEAKRQNLTVQNENRTQDQANSRLENLLR